MQVNILWTGREYYSLENCLVTTKSSGTSIRSTIIGLYEEKIYQADYHIQTNASWVTVFVEISCRHNNKLQHIILESDGKGNWKENGKNTPRLNGCTDVDIPLTPFTNTLPIKRLKLLPGAIREIDVVYCDLLAEQINPVRQQYTCRTPERYHYQNVPNDFEATITIDQDGFVIDYPSLFIRTAYMRSAYEL